MIHGLEGARSRSAEYERLTRAARPRAYGGERDADGPAPLDDRALTDRIGRAGDAFRAFHGGTLPSEHGQRFARLAPLGASPYGDLSAIPGAAGRDLGALGEQPPPAKARRTRRTRRTRGRRTRRTGRRQRTQRTRSRRTRQDPRTRRAQERRPVRTDGPRTQGETGIPNGLRPNAAEGAREVRRLGFRGTIGGLGHRSGPSDHPHGNAIDVMTHRDRATGRRVAEHFRRNAQRLGVKYVIFEQMIASPRTGWQWRRMADRGNPTANHMDHVHVSFH